MDDNSSKYDRDIIIKYVLSKTPEAVRERLFKMVFRKLWHKQQKKRTSVSGGYSLAPFDKHKCIFVHIPKCAGVSVSTTLFGCLGGGHMEMWKYQLIFGEKAFDEYFKFAVVRNPWDRLHSAFCFLKGGGYGNRDRKWFEENVGREVSFEYFVKNILVKKNIRKKNHFILQVNYMKDLSGNLNMNHIARFEKLPEEMSLLSSKLNSNNNLVRTNVTKTKRKSYQHVYDAQMKDIVGNIYVEDIERLQYNFNNK